MNRNYDGDNNKNIDTNSPTQMPTHTNSEPIGDKENEKNENMTTSVIHMENENKKSIPFWAENPNILFQSEYLLEFFPIDEMTYEQKMNAISRLITILTIVGFVISRNVRILLIYVVTLGGICLAYYMQKKKVGENGEGFSTNNPGIDFLKQKNLFPKEQLFDSPSSENPMSNVLMTDYDYNPHKKPAGPSYNKNINEDILSQAKQFIADANPDQPDIVKKLFHNVDDQLGFEHSMRQFYSNPNTMIPNDQQAFAEFCYGSMVSCKEGNRFACARNLARHTN
jgi:hypothetical protein